MSDDLFSRLDSQLNEGQEQPEKPAHYSIIDRAGPDFEEQGRLAAHHVERIGAARAIAQIQRGALGFEIEKLKRQLAEAEKRLATVDDWIDKATHHDRSVLYDWVTTSPEIMRLRAKSFPVGAATIGSRTMTRKADVKIAQPEALVDLIPECVKRTLIVSEAKKCLRALDTGQVMVASTGEIVPLTVAACVPGETREKPYVKIGNDEFELFPYIEPNEEAPGNEPEEDTDDGTGRDDTDAGLPGSDETDPDDF